MRIPSACVLAALSASCILYNPSSFKDLGTPFAGRRVELPCIDLATTQTDDAAATGPVIQFSFGNRCMHQTHIDLSSVRAVGRYADGTRALHAYDPHHELRSLQIDALWMGHEEIEYLGDDGSAPTALCIDVGHIEVSATATDHWLCFGSWDIGADLAARYGKSDTTPPELTPDCQSGWPLPEGVDRAVTSIPPGDNVSIESVGKYLAQHFSDKRALVKAIHDYVALRLDYDEHAATLIDQKEWGAVPSQEAEEVFERRTAVCAGYAKLMAALGKAAGVEIAYITGYARDATTMTVGSLDSHAHAWNAAQVDGHWLLIDTTWDHRSGGNVGTTYLFTPPALFATSHIPDESNWQLMTPSLSLDDFVRQASLGGGR